MSLKINRNNRYEAQLTKEENDLIEKLIQTRTYLSGQMQFFGIMRGSNQRDISNSIGRFALSHRLHLKKTYELVGEYPHYFIRKVAKKPFVKPPSGGSDKVSPGTKENLPEKEETPAEAK